MTAGEIPDTPAGRQLGWWLDAIDHPETMTAEDVLGRYTRTWPNSPWLKGDEEGRQGWKNNWTEFGEFRIEAIESESDVRASVILAPTKGSRRKITFIVEPEPPHRIRMERWEQVFDFDLKIREATPADADVLADIERRSMVVVGDTKTITDRGEDYFAAARLIPDVAVFLAEIEGQPAGLAWGAQVPARFKGEDINVTYFFHLRIAPEFQRRGLWGALDNAVSWKYWEKSDMWVGYFLIDNVAWSHVAEQVQARPGFVTRDWIPTVYRLLVPTATCAGAPAGRPATPADAGTVAEILNEFHDGEEFYSPYTAETLSQRLSGDPSYSWDQVRITDNAVLGVWPAGRTVKVVIERGEETVTSRRAFAMDYGFRAGAEDEFRGLFGAAAAEACEQGLDTLSVFTSRGSRGNAVLRGFEATVESYRFNTGTTAMIPDSAQETGLYTDHAVF